MRRRDFMKSGVLGAAAAYVPPHNFDKYDFGSGPVVENRLNQGPFPADLYPSWTVVMALTPSEEIAPNYGMGLVTYLCDEVGLLRPGGTSTEAALEELVKFPLGTDLYVRVNWKDVQQRPGRLDPSEIWKTSFALAKQYRKRIGFRVMISNPDIEGYALPDFIREKVPMVKLGDRQKRQREEPRCDDPYFQSAFQELMGLLAADYDGNPDVEYVDTCMYGFWGEGHTWPLEKNPYPDYTTAEDTFVKMFHVQRGAWKKTPLVTNTQPDFSKVGNSELVDQTIRRGEWLRTDTIFIENEQIEALSNRPPWTAAVLEGPLPGKIPPAAAAHEGVSPAENIIAHVMDVGANYWSVWSFHQINPKTLMDYYQASPAWFDRINRRIGYRVRPSFIWSYEDSGYQGLIIGFANDGIAGVPGVLRVSVESEDGKTLKTGCLDAGYPLPGKIRQAQFVLPQGTKWKGLKLKAEIEVKGMRYPVRWACHQKLNDDGSLTLRPNLRQEV